MADKLNWGILGAGYIGGRFAEGLGHSETGRLVAVASRDQAKADAFARKFAAKKSEVRAWGSYEAILADPTVEAVYIATPHPMHAEWAIKAAEAGKHILCEKPLAMNHREAAGVVAAARKHDVFLMEAFMYRCAPQTARIVDLVRGGALGQVRVIRATFSFQTGWNPEGRLLNKKLGGGGILDVGCYPVSIARPIAGLAAGKDFAEPEGLEAFGYLGATGVDEWAVAILRFPGDVMAVLSTGVQVAQDNAVCVFGTEGYLEIPWPWGPSREGGTTQMTLRRNGEPAKEISVKTTKWIYGLEADAVAANIERRQAASPAMSWDDSLGNMKVLDRWREAIGLRYEADDRS
jgi:predicted dehydrogenase